MKLVIVSVIIGLLASMPYIYYAIKHPEADPDFFECASIIGWIAGCFSSIWTAGRATYYGWFDPSQLGAFQSEYFVILIGCIALVWAGIRGVCSIYRPVLDRYQE